MDKLAKFDVQHFRQFFPYFRKEHSSICFDGVGGTQVPDSVIEAIANHLRNNNGNRGGVFPRSVETMRLMNETRSCIADLINAPDADEIILDANFTTLTFNLSRAISRTWAAKDEIVVSRLDHDANVSPWVFAAEDAGVKIRYFDIEDETCQLTTENLRAVINDRTRLVSFCAASSSVGTRPDVKALTALAHRVGALVYLDAVAYAAHAPIDVQDWGADFVGCSGYKFFGPHMSFVWGKRHFLETISAYKVRPAPETLPIKWVNGAQTYELAAGLKAAIEYIAYVGQANPSHNYLFPHFDGRRLHVHAGVAAMEAYEQLLMWPLIAELKSRARIKLWGITDEHRKNERVPPVAVSVAGVKPNDLAIYLASRGIDVWSRSVYSISLSERLGLEGRDNRGNIEGFIRIGLSHYNTDEEVRCLLRALDEYVE
jgi:cysteine desulfurase family protein (TIGR01976 family)